MDSNKTVYYANNLEEVFYQLKTVAGLQLVGGCTGHDELADNFLSVRNLPELSKLEKHERFFDFGPAITLSELEEVGRNNLPVVLYDAIKSIANPQVRNIATLGGNICTKKSKMTLYAPLLALDTRLELQHGTETIYIPLTKFTEIPPEYLLTKIRVPLEEWEVTVFRRLGPSHHINERSASFVFLTNTQNSQISSIRIAFAGEFWFRSLELENKLLGSHLPIPEKSINEMVEEAGRQFDEAAEKAKKEPLPILRDQFLNLVKFSLEQLTY
ncbi:MAG: FAD binding domain-containing protein [Treponema sp.]|nr:FAD binding domain-containing protein [Treponema sp.]